MSTADDQREQRQFALTRDRVSGLRSGTLHLGIAVATLETLLGATMQKQERKDRFIDAWSVLEIAYAVEEDRLQSIPTALTDPNIAGALSDLDALIDAVAEPKS
jgi:hypothetical protein